MNLAVAPADRRRGIAGALLERVFAVTADDAQRGYTLEVRVSNVDAIRLYERHGFAAPRPAARLLHGQSRGRPDHVALLFASWRRGRAERRARLSHRLSTHRPDASGPWPIRRPARDNGPRRIRTASRSARASVASAESWDCCQKRLGTQHLGASRPLSWGGLSRGCRSINVPPPTSSSPISRCASVTAPRASQVRPGFRFAPRRRQR